jgi:hypothetical protein
MIFVGKNERKGKPGGECSRRWFWWGNLGEREKLQGLAVDGRIILRGVFKKEDGRNCLD